MSTGQPSRRVQRAKSEVTHNRISVSRLKEEYRNRFLNRLRLTRSKSVDRFRQIVESFADEFYFTSLSDLRKILLSDKEATELLNSDAVNSLLTEVEAEMAQVSLENEVEDYTNATHSETEDIINRLMNTCPFCECLTVDRVCLNCSKFITSEFH